MHWHDVNSRVSLVYKIFASRRFGKDLHRLLEKGIIDVHQSRILTICQVGSRDRSKHISHLSNRSRIFGITA